MKCRHGQGSKRSLDSATTTHPADLNLICRGILVHLPGKQKAEHQPKIQTNQPYCRARGQNILGRKKQFWGININQVDWTTIEMVITGQMINMRRWTTKFVTSFCATGSRMAHTTQCPTTDCPWCGYPQETTSHILQCPQPESQNLWDTTILHSGSSC